MEKEKWEIEFDKFAEDLCVAFIPDGEGDESNMYLSEIMGMDELKNFIRGLLTK